MSLILDALRKADAERERGSVPSLRSQPVVPRSAEAPPRPEARRGWLSIAIGIAVGLAIAATWVAVGRNDPHANAPAATAAQATTTGAPPSAAAFTPVTNAAPSPPATTYSGPQDVAQPAPWPDPDQRRTARADAKDDAQAPRAGSGPEADAQLYPRDLLPSHIRGALPQLAISGSIYSDDPASRSLIIDGRLFREGGRLTQELTLEEIKPKAAVFRFRGYRFEVLF